MEMTDEEFIEKRTNFIVRVKNYIDKLNNTSFSIENRIVKLKYVLKILEITDLNHDVIFNNHSKFGMSKKFVRIVKEKYISFIIDEPNEKELVFRCKKFLNKYYNMNFIINCLAYTIKGLPCKKGCKDIFCHTHRNFSSKTTDILNTVFIPDITRICIDKIF